MSINVNINNIKKQNVSLPQKSLVAIIGKSGSGKSSLARFLEKNLDNCVCISQKLPKGNIKSSIVTYLEVNKIIASHFANFFKKDTSYFMNNNSDIVCPLCNGSGVIKYERGFESSISITCTQCYEKMFSELASSFAIENKTILDFYDCEIKTLRDTNITKLAKIATMAENLLLGYLSFNRKINTLSGGELKRLKILKHLLKKMDNKILIIDEPSAGLDYKNAQNIIEILKTTKNTIHNYY